jgi:hypothetical protein
MSDGGTRGPDDHGTGGQDQPGGQGQPGGGWGDTGGQGQPGGGWGDTGGQGQPGGGWGDTGGQGQPGGYSSPAPGGGQWGGGDTSGYPPPPGGGGGTNTMAVAAIACGIASLIFLIVFFPLGILLAIAGLVLGIMGLRAGKRQGTGGKGMAIAGIVTSTITLFLLVLGIIGLVFVFNQFERNPFTDPEGFMEELEQEGFEFDEEGNVVDVPDSM